MSALNVVHPLFYFLFFQATSDEKHVSAVQGAGEGRLWGGE